MVLLIALSTALSVALVVTFVLQAIPGRSKAVQTRMVEMGLHGMLEQDQARSRARQRSKLSDLLRYLGDSMEARGSDWSATRLRLIRAGYREPSAVPVYLGIRFGATGLLAVYGFLLGAIANVSGAFPIICGVVGAGAGWMVPKFMLSARIGRRQKELQKALPDAVDLLVICVEAGLGLNQALVRVAEEIRHVSRLMTEELALANMAIRAGTPREQALLDLAERTGLSDIRSLVTMVIQTDRFGTSVAKSLRVHSESMRTKRRQRAEEEAAKTTIKMVFPLTFCIFPALFVVVLGPAFISIFETFGQLN
jgi:tight adherence protein C